MRNDQKHLKAAGRMRLLCWVVFFGISVVQPAFAPAFADDYLIRELETLRNSLSPDDASRPELTLRLADVLFDEALVVSQNAAGLSQARTYRQKALSLYEEALNGSHGRFQLPNSSLQSKIRFQMARLHESLNQEKQAIALWNRLLNEAEDRELKREAALKLAESLEAKGDSKSIEKADLLYQQAIGLCGGSDLCSYGHYRRAWLLFKNGKLKPAIQAMELALFDSKGQVREESLRDYLVFLSSDGSNGEDALTQVEALAGRIGRPQLLEDLSIAYYGAGNKVAGTRVLEFVNARKPALKHQIRLLEEYYGARDWAKYSALLDSTRLKTPARAKAGSVSEVENEKILRRLTVQLDGERLTNPERISEFQTTVSLYLKLFPSNEHRAQMIDGWIAAEKNEDRKIQQLATWIQEEAAGKRTSEEIRLRKIRAASAQKLKNPEIVAEESAALAALVPSSEKREYTYLQARALYQLKRFDEALPLFQDLAKGEAADRWGIQSQNLALDILSQQKRYSDLIAQAEAWTGQEALLTKIPNEIAQMQKIALQARFEKAAAAGKHPEALATFQEFCLAKKFLPKSCENAQTLAIQLKDQHALISILKARGLRPELAAELEASGYFAQAAEILAHDRLSAPGAKPDIRDFLKIALLFELDGKNQRRNEVLQKALKSSWLKKSASITEPEEAALLQAVMEAQLLDPTVLKLAWRPVSQQKIAHELELSGKGNGTTRKLLLASTTNLGQAWERVVLEEATRLQEKQAKQGFYGRRSKARFERRLKSLQSLVSRVEKVLPAAGIKTRLALLEILKSSHDALASEILASPLPEALPEEARVQIQASLQEMAAPFQAKAQDYARLSSEITPSGDTLVTSSAAPMRDQKAIAKSASRAKKALETLHRSPLDIQALDALKAFHEQKGQVRLAAYFQGRLTQAKKEKP